MLCDSIIYEEKTGVNPFFLYVLTIVKGDVIIVILKLMVRKWRENMNFKKSLSLVLAAQMLLLNGAACGNTGNEPDETQKNAETSAAVQVEEETGLSAEPAETEFSRASVEDNLPDVTFDGREFRILTAEGDWMNQYTYDEDLSGDTLNNAIWKRNEDVENRFDVKINAFADSTESQDSFTQYVFVGDDLFDVCDMMMYMSYVPLAYNMVINWYDIPYIDWEKPWWNKATNDEATIHGKAFAVTGDLSLTSLTYMWMQAFNIDLLEDWGHSAAEMYQLVFDGKWTLDKFVEICSEIYNDENGDSIADRNDMFGYATSTFTGTDPWVTAIDARIMTKNSEGVLEVTLGTERVHNTLEKLVGFFFSSKGCYQDPSSDMSNGANFGNGKIAIVPSMFRSCLDSFAELDFNYGILPYPKYDEVQEKYMTGAMDQLSVYSVPVTLPTEQYDFLGIMMEALNAESYKTVYPAYFEDALKGRYSTDENMAKVLDIIVDGRLFDLAFMYGIYIERLPYQFRYCFRDQTTDLASKLAENKNGMEEKLEDLMTYYETGEQIWY